MICNLAAYQFVRIDDIDTLLARLREHCAQAGLLGTILVAEEGINCFLAGARSAIDSFVDWIHIDPRFADMPIKLSDSDAVPFRHLRIKRKAEIISFRRAGIHPERGRAASVSAQELFQWLQVGRDAEGREICLLDTRNEEEVAHGTFEGALSLPIRCFTQLPDALEQQREAMAGKTIVSFCTGGIRCEKSAIWMQEAGFENVLQLDGGILGYFEQVGGFGYRDRCFVFDDRVALDPQLRPLVPLPAES